MGPLTPRSPRRIRMIYGVNTADRPTIQGGYEIPDGNLFPKDGSEGRPEIYVMGCRNPWRMSVDSDSGIVYWGEVGPDAGGEANAAPEAMMKLTRRERQVTTGGPISLVLTWLTRIMILPQVKMGRSISLYPSMRVQIILEAGASSGSVGLDLLALWQVGILSLWERVEEQPMQDLLISTRVC